MHNGIIDSSKSRVAYTHNTVANTSGIPRFEVTASFTPVAGDLPVGVSGVFVMQVAASGDPKDDTFLRVALLGDLGKAAANRNDAVNAATYAPAAGALMVSAGGTSEGLYLSSTVTLPFNDLQVAIQAKRVLEQRVDTLLSDWKAYRDAFYAADLTYFPLITEGVVAAAKAVYYAAKDELTAANDDKAAKDAAKDAAEVAYTAKQTEYNRLAALQPLVCPSVAQLGVFEAAYTTYFTSSDGRTGLVSALTAAGGRQTAIDSDATAYAQLTAAKATIFTPAVATLTTACTTVTNQLSQANTEKNNAYQTLVDAINAVAAAVRRVDFAETAKEDALDSLLAVCPSFTDP